MNRAVVFTHQAKLEFEGAVIWYEQRLTGLGNEFRTEVNEMIREILDCPERFRHVSASVQKASLPRFPYSIFFSVETEVVNLVAIFHGARNPMRLRHRLG